MNTFDRIKDLFKVVTPEIETADLSRSSLLKTDLGMDSLEIEMLLIVIEDEFNLSADDNIHFSTIGDICDYIEDVKCTG